jgi:carbamate kinase
MAKGLILALGGNALIRAGEEGDIPQQYQHTRETFAPLIPMLAEYSQALIVHGNGPQVGNELLRNEIASFSVVPMPLDTCVASSQGNMGYMIQQVLQNELAAKKVERMVVTIVTQTIVDPQDVAFHEPTKPIGTFYKTKEAERFQKTHGWKMVEDAGRGFRRVVPSPLPIDIVEMAAIRTLYKSGAIVIAGGGGGIPVIKSSKGIYQGIEAVVDKDYITALFANRLRPELLLMLTGVPHVDIGHKTPKAKPLRQVKLADLITHYKNGEFSVGSMAPKISCAISFLKTNPGKVLITSPECLAGALKGKEGTWIEA